MSFYNNKNKRGRKFVETLSVILSKCWNDHYLELALTAAKIMGQLIISRKNSNHSSATKIKHRGLHTWWKGEFDNLRNDVGKVRLVGNKRRPNFHEYREFDKHMASGNLKNAVGCSSDESRRLF